MADLSVFDKYKSIGDFQRANEEWMLKKKLAQAQIDKSAMGGDLPSSIQEWNNYNAMSPQDQQRYLQMKRADQIMNLGGQMAVRNPMGGIMESYTVTPKMSEMPEFEADVSKAKALGQVSGELIGAQGKKASQANDSMATINEILTPDETGRNLLDKATGSTLGAGYAAGKQIFGVSDESTQANAALTVLGGKLVSNVPRMEGPQSNIDVQFYKEQAGKIADPTIPAGDKRAALDAIARLNEKYSNQQDPMQNWLNAVSQQENKSPYANIPQMMEQSPALTNMPNMKQPAAMKNSIEVEESIFNAKKAIRNGANPEAVRQRLVEAGIDPSKAGL